MLLNSISKHWDFEELIDSPTASEDSPGIALSCLARQQLKPDSSDVEQEKVYG